MISGSVYIRDLHAPNDYTRCKHRTTGDLRADRAPRKLDIFNCECDILALKLPA